MQDWKLHFLESYSDLPGANKSSNPVVYFQLALWQTHHVVDLLKKKHPDVECEIGKYMDPELK